MPTTVVVPTKRARRHGAPQVPPLSAAAEDLQAKAAKHALSVPARRGLARLARAIAQPLGSGFGRRVEVGADIQAPASEIWAMVDQDRKSVV